MSTNSTAQESPLPEPAPAPVIPWEVLDLIANILDPKTLATASCVSKSWRAAMSSDHLWAHLCTTEFPSLTHLRSVTDPSLPYHRLYNISFTSTKRRQRQPSNPKISLQNLFFTITLNNSTSPPITVIAPGTTLALHHDTIFRFDFDMRNRNVRGIRDKWREFEVTDETVVTWNVVLEGFGSVFTMMDCKGKGRFISGSDGWFSAELPSSGCCCASSGGGMVAEMRLSIREKEGEGGGGDGRRRTEVGSVNVGVLSIVSWRYVSVEDCLRYLQHFLQPACDV